jgi:hypothetical protein
MANGHAQPVHYITRHIAFPAKRVPRRNLFYGKRVKLDGCASFVELGHGIWSFGVAQSVGGLGIGVEDRLQIETKPSCCI